jgi:hypothetical protein
MSMLKLEVGQTFVFYVPPGWLLAGTIAEFDDQEVALTDIVYLETTAQGTSPVSDLPMAKNDRQVKASSGTTWPMPNGTVVRREAMLFRTPCAHNVKILARAKDADAIKGAS